MNYQISLHIDRMDKQIIINSTKIQWHDIIKKFKCHQSRFHEYDKYFLRDFSNLMNDLEWMHIRETIKLKSDMLSTFIRHSIWLNNIYTQNENKILIKGHTNTNMPYFGGGFTILIDVHGYKFSSNFRDLTILLH